MHVKKRLLSALFVIIIGAQVVTAQYKTSIQFTPDGNSYYLKEEGAISKVNIKTGETLPVIKKAQLTPAGETTLNIASWACGLLQTSLGQRQFESHLQA